MCVADSNMSLILTCRRGGMPNVFPGSRLERALTSRQESELQDSLDDMDSAIKQSLLHVLCPGGISIKRLGVMMLCVGAFIHAYRAVCWRCGDGDGEQLILLLV